jgi:hypothetical protein
MEEVMNAQTKYPGWPARLGVTAFAVVVAMIAAAAIAHVPPNVTDTETSHFSGNVLTDPDAHRKAVAAAAEEGSYVTGFVEFDENGITMKDDGLGPLSETSDPEIAD